MNCEDCGTKFSDGMCPNCHEELFILETQGEYIDMISDEFAAKVAEQRREVEAVSKKGQ